MEPILTDDQLPLTGQDVLWWHPRKGDWLLGPFRSIGQGKYAPGYFRGDGEWWVCDGPTYWMPKPPPPSDFGASDVSGGIEVVPEEE